MQQIGLLKAPIWTAVSRYQPSSTRLPTCAYSTPSLCRSAVHTISSVLDAEIQIIWCACKQVLVSVSNTKKVARIPTIPPKKKRWLVSLLQSPITPLSSRHGQAACDLCHIWLRNAQTTKHMRVWESRAIVLDSSSCIFFLLRTSRFQQVHSFFCFVLHAEKGNKIRYLGPIPTILVHLSMQAETSAIQLIRN